ncbi:unnamed protein product [Ilex paraguariensis]|uniref:JmjC domain-containing protein n=1 Tax=Ilex paraguariensis TaxID=185542 RepID=A0ABC8QTW2_9AQUA
MGRPQTTERPDLSVHPRADRVMEYSQKVILHAGDALFIPEGWFHQVDSDNLTIAVNFWWRSEMMSTMPEHMDAYYLRRILKRLTDKEMNEMLHMVSTVKMANTIGQPNNGNADLVEHLDQNYDSKISKATMLKEKIMLHELEPLALQSLHELISIVHERVNVGNQSQPNDSTSANYPEMGEKDEAKKTFQANIFNLEENPVASILWNLQPLTLQSVFLAMAHNFPRTLEALILHLLSPVGAEILTRKFDEMDQLTAEEDRNQFYQIFYGVFDDQFAAMDALLNGKESFALQAYQNVLDKYLVINFDGAKSLV